tara:strand:+ start:159 stop:545 length:387 start_codon:yes stop_codon:yes gene_type:complete
MNDFFFELILKDKNLLILRFILFPIITVVIYYLSLIFFSRKEYINETILKSNFLINIQFSRFYSLLSSLIVLNIYWFLLLYFNGLTKINFNFLFSLDNLYLQLMPLFLCNIIIVIIYTNTKNKINNLL